MCVSECVCLFCTLDVLVCNPFLGVCVLTASLAELLILFHAFAETCFVLQSHLFIYVCLWGGGGSILHT